MRPPTRACPGAGHRCPASPNITRRRTWASQVTGPSVRTCRGHLPRRARRPLVPCARTPLLPSGRFMPWAPGRSVFSWLACRGPHAHVPTHRRPRRRDRRKARFRLVGLTLPGWDSHPLDDSSEFRRVSACSPPFGPALPGRFEPVPVELSSNSSEPVSISLDIDYGHYAGCSESPSPRPASWLARCREGPALPSVEPCPPEVRNGAQAASFGPSRRARDAVVFRSNGELV